VLRKQDKVQYNNDIREPVKKAAYYNTSIKHYHSKAAGSFILNTHRLTRKLFRLNYFWSQATVYIRFLKQGL
jgi:hypothetical protein